MIAWEKISSTDFKLIDSIVRRAAESGIVFVDTLNLRMDICAVHLFSPLRLRELLAATNFNFVRYVAGIQKHLDRETGKLQKCFIPWLTK